MKKIYIITLVILVAAITFFVWNQKKHTGQETHTYSNEQYGFEFKYPDNFEILQVQTEAPSSLLQVALAPIVGDESNTIWTVILNKGEDCSAELGGNETKGAFIAGFESKRSKKIIEDPESFVKSDMSCISKNNVSYIFHLSHDQTESYDYDSFEKMTASFRFTK